VSDPTTETPVGPVPEEFSLDETRRLAAIEAAKSVPTNNFDDFLSAAQRVEQYIKTGEITKPDEGVPVALS
jgi:hypothetical protein